MTFCFLPQNLLPFSPSNKEAVRHTHSLLLKPSKLFASSCWIVTKTPISYSYSPQNNVGLTFLFCTFFCISFVNIPLFGVVSRLSIFCSEEDYLYVSSYHVLNIYIVSHTHIPCISGALYLSTYCSIALLEPPNNMVLERGKFV